MNPDSLRELLEGIRARAVAVSDAEEILAALPFTEAEGALIDTHRALRQVVPEVVYAGGKTVPQVASALVALTAQHGRALATRVGVQMARGLGEALGGGSYNPVSRLYYTGEAAVADRMRGAVAVVTAGTSDLRVAEEAAGTLEFFGCPVEKFYDVGVAGLHRLLARVKEIREASAVIVVAGMDAALGGVVGGIVAAPVIAVPTSVGYGASFGGLSALLAMLNACAPGVTVVNIDNGFGAAAAALRLQRK